MKRYIKCNMQGNYRRNFYIGPDEYQIRQWANTLYLYCIWNEGSDPELVYKTNSYEDLTTFIDGLYKDYGYNKF